ncbi:hypothetical protein BDN72DRAFT_610705 [Pluteus cervinus]|uniref:Uncharacterized protein n=1 Tax=Pluteus cervinus TaxID=181527 RepID=A0ACD3AUW8_9AGAR|nr:hypothetical protein BDN72DRAFT_610705 [Pluteus cervinus]
MVLISGRVGAGPNLSVFFSERLSLRGSANGSLRLMFTIFCIATSCLHPLPVGPAHARVNWYAPTHVLPSILWVGCENSCRPNGDVLMLFAHPTAEKLFTVKERGDCSEQFPRQLEHAASNIQLPPRIQEAERAINYRYSTVCQSGTCGH